MCVNCFSAHHDGIDINDTFFFASFDSYRVNQNTNEFGTDEGQQEKCKIWIMLHMCGACVNGSSDRKHIVR